MPMRIIACLLLTALTSVAQAEGKNYIEPTAKTPIWREVQGQAGLYQTRKIKNIGFSEDPSFPDKTRNIASKGSDDNANQGPGYTCNNRTGN